MTSAAGNWRKKNGLQAPVLGIKRNLPEAFMKNGGPGRGKGTINKLHAQAKENINEAFLRVGGTDGFVKWINESERNRTIFYRDIYTKLIPVQIKAKVEQTVDTDGINAINALERTLTNLLIERQRGGEEAITVIDARAGADAGEVLELPGPSGTDTA